VKGEYLIVEDMDKVMFEEYRIFNRAYTKTIKSESAVLLFTGFFYNCGKSGHFAKD
jgi:hypothetical protein